MKSMPIYSLFGGIYKVQTEAEEGPTISFTIPCRD